MPDLESIIAQSVQDHTGGSDDSHDSDSGPDSGDVAAESTGAVAGAGPDASAGTAAGPVATSPTGADGTAAAVVAPVQDDLDKELEALGIKPGVERENRIPYKRVKKIVENAKKALSESHTKALGEHTTKLTAAEQRLATMDSVDKLIASDPERYISMLAALHPDKYGKFVGRQAEPAAPVADPAKDDPRPGPDGQYTDGTPGYTAAGQQKLDEWRDRQVEKRIRAEYDKRLGPIERERQAAVEIQQRLPGVKNQVSKASKRWGKAFDDDYNKANDGQSEILKVLQANDGQNGRPHLSFEEACAEVLLPKVYAERNVMREDILKELNARPAAAAKTPAAAAVVAADGNTPRDLTDVIRASIASLKR